MLAEGRNFPRNITSWLVASIARKLLVLSQWQVGGVLATEAGDLTRSPPRDEDMVEDHETPTAEQPLLATN